MDHVSECCPPSTSTWVPPSDLPEEHFTAETFSLPFLKTKLNARGKPFPASHLPSSLHNLRSTPWFFQSSPPQPHLLVSSKSVQAFTSNTQPLFSNSVMGLNFLTSLVLTSQQQQTRWMNPTLQNSPLSVPAASESSPTSRAVPSQASYPPLPLPSPSKHQRPAIFILSPLLHIFSIGDLMQPLALSTMYMVYVSFYVHDFSFSSFKLSTKFQAHVFKLHRRHPHWDNKGMYLRKHDQNKLLISPNIFSIGVPIPIHGISILQFLSQ